jgi:hypothetical protein
MGTPDFELLAASLRADATDLRAFVEALAMKLEGALPGTIKVARGGGGLFGGGRKRVEQISVGLGSDSFELESDDGRVRCSRRTVVRGIALKNEELTLDEWIDGVSRALVAEAESSERGRAALGRLLDA